MGRLRSAASNAVLLLAALLVVFAGLELWFRLMAPQRSDSGGMFEVHPELGWTFKASHRGAIVHPGGAAHYLRINAHGFRDDPFDREAGFLRLAVIGDSFVSNISVERDEVFTEVLERGLPGVSVMNLGVNGYGQVQELLLLESMLRELSPDLVLVLVYLRNDFDDNGRARWKGARLRRPTARLDRGGRVVIDPLPPPLELATTPKPPPRAGRSPLEGLHTTHFLRLRLAYLLDRLAAELPSETIGELGPRSPRQPFDAPELSLCAVEPDAETEKRYRVTEQLLLKMHSRAARAGVRVVFSLAPSMVQVVPELWERVEREAVERGVQLDAELPNRRLLSLAERHRLAMIDLLPSLRAAEARGESTYNPIGQHWTASGNRVVAEALGEFLRSDPRSRTALRIGAG